MTRQGYIAWLDHIIPMTEIRKRIRDKLLEDAIRMISPEDSRDEAFMATVAQRLAAIRAIPIAAPEVMVSADDAPGVTYDDP